MKRPPLTDEFDRANSERDAKKRKEQSSAEDKAIDAAVRKSIKLHGA